MWDHSKWWRIYCAFERTPSLQPKRFFKLNDRTKKTPVSEKDNVISVVEFTSEYVQYRERRSVQDETNRGKNSSDHCDNHCSRRRTGEYHHLQTFYYHPPTKLREGNAFISISPWGGGRPHVTIAHDALEFTATPSYPLSPQTWDPRDPPTLIPSPSPPLVLTSGDSWSRYGQRKRVLRILLKCFLGTRV